MLLKCTEYIYIFLKVEQWEDIAKGMAIYKKKGETGKPWNK